MFEYKSETKTDRAALALQIAANLIYAQISMSVIPGTDLSNRTARLATDLLVWLKENSQ